MFRNISGGLIAKGAERTGFTMAGSNGKILPAKAVIDGGSVVVTSEKIIKPETVRWGVGSCGCGEFIKSGRLASCVISLGCSVTGDLLGFFCDRIRR